MRRAIEWLLVLFFIAGIALMALANPDPALRNWLCHARGACLYSEHATYWNTLLYDIGLGAAISIVFYWLLVRWPEYLKRRRLKRFLQDSYKRFRMEIVFAVVEASRSSTEAGPSSGELAFARGFKEYFKQPSQKVDGSRWHDVANGLNEFILRDILASFRVLKDNTAYVLNNLEIADDEAFEFLHNMTAVLEYRQDTSLEYDDTKSLLRLIWEIMTGYNFVSGYAKTDPVARIIKRI